MEQGLSSCVKGRNRENIKVDGQYFWSLHLSPTGTMRWSPAGVGLACRRGSTSVLRLSKHSRVFRGLAGTSGNLARRRVAENLRCPALLASKMQTTSRISGGVAFRMHCRPCLPVPDTGASRTIRTGAPLTACSCRPRQVKAQLEHGAPRCGSRVGGVM